MPPSMKFHSPPKRAPAPIISANDDENANNLLEMRSQAIQGILRERDRVGQFGMVSVSTTPNPTAEALHTHLGVDQVVLVSSPLQIDTTAGGGIMPEKAKYANPSFPHQRYPPGQITYPVNQAGTVGVGQAYGRQLRGGWPAF